MYSSNDFEGIPDIKFEEEVNGDKVAARGEQSGVIYIDLEELLGKTPTEVVSILVHESVHSEKITQSSGSKLTEEIFVKDKESQVADKFKEEKEGLSEKEQKEQEEYLAKLDKENEGLREYSDNLEADSFSEEVEGHGGSDLYVQGAQLGYTGDKLESWVNSKRLEQAQVAIKNGATKEQTIALLKTLWDLGPGGNITGLVEAVYGKDLATKEELDLLTRLLSVVGAAEFAKGGKLTREVVEKAIKNDKELQALSKKTGIDINIQLFGGKVDGNSYVNLASEKRTQHILFGDAKGGGHIWPGAPGKSAFPKDWSPDKIMNEVSDLVTDPNIKWNKNKVVKGIQRYEIIGVKDGVKIKIITDGKDIVTAYPIK